MIRKFITYLETELRLSAHTVEAYQRDLTQFASYVTGGKTEEFSPSEISSYEIRSWIGDLADNGISPSSLRRKIQSLRSFYKWGMQCGKLEKNPAADITLPKKRRKLPNFIRQEEIEEILEETKSDFKSERSHIVLEILYGLGLRQAELLSLTDADFNKNSREIKVTGKRDKQRVIPVPDKLCAEIEKWQSVRDLRYPDLKEPKALIAGPHGHLSRYHLYKIVHEALGQTTTGRKSPHTLRHSFATAMINEGAHLDSVREILGHVSLSTTQIYTHLSFKELLQNYKTGHPRAKSKDPESV